ncbi:hypothetical protein [Microvirga sp. TS319]|uniref:hypothetical protein n=1 Tax=Microvirga sp. TS319 TaxID=3241165 RepID=UPI00351A33AA
MIILYGIVAVCSGILTMVLLWPLGLLIASSAAILIGAVLIVCAALVRFMARSAGVRRGLGDAG